MRASKRPKVVRPAIDWGYIASQLPVKKNDHVDKQKRLKLWNSIDMNGNGYLSLAEIDKGIKATIKSNALFDAKPAIMRAFQHAKDYCPAKNKNKYSDDYVEKREFRVFLVALR